MSFIYEYSEQGIRVRGAFTGEVSEHGLILGTWKEAAEEPIDGRTSWQGSGYFQDVSQVDRCLLAGTWHMPGIHERWLVDAPI